MRWFPLSLFIYPKLCSFGLLLKMRCIFFTEQSFTDRRFCRLCNQFLPKTLRFSLQRHKTREFGLRRIPGIICRFSLWNSAGCVRIWLGAFGKAGLFRCQSGIRGLGLTVFDKKRLFRCQSRIRGFWLVALDRLGVC